MSGVVSVLPNTKLQLHTTRSWDFMGLTKSYISQSKGGGDVIVGMLDTGIWPESKSFDDEGFGPPPVKWKGTCQTADNFTCNNKIIGARFYKSKVVEGASYYGLATGAARGGLPSARIAVYKVCWYGGCPLADILAAFDDAIADGVDIISVSLGSEGSAINSFALNRTSYPLIWGGDAANVSAGANSDIASFCGPGTLNSQRAEGKIVLCDTLWDGAGVMNPVATILLGEAWKDVMAPVVFSFSSRGYNPITPDILKPNLTAPGVDILAAWSPVSSPSSYVHDTRTADYNIISGTSMSSPHASGAAAYVKAAHPTWSPAAIKSALMTTAYVMDPRKNEDMEFGYGSGHINPVKAVDPGLVFDADESDYVDFLCKQGYNTSSIRLITGDSSACKNNTTPGPAWDLNYPSFSLAIVDGEQIMGTFTRTVTNVGSNATTYYSSLQHSCPSPH
ncbi:Subtilisin-like protease SBT4.6 [Thalictrum thalictroides]|uniref:Subtilisin-like protease SBT4.6 n=1 Tax=Thalictrum thalictroides TaxID=46969 RepID=A0A7J6VNI8_THATH|nr:Subtilisin-like protease SBT4.6 [Thalictrum thalictroides]